MAVPAGGRTVDEYRVEAFGAVGDASSHTLSSLGYTSLAVAQNKYPAATDLSDEADWCAIQGAVNAANAAGGGLVVLAAKTYRTNREIIIKAGVSIRGVRPRTRIVPTASNSFSAIRVQTGVFTGGLGFITASTFVEGIWIHGPSALTYPTGSTTPGLLVDGSTMCVFRDITVSNYAFGVDLINNCYNCVFYNLTIPRFAACELGINLREGGQSGSDLYFFKTHISAWKCCVNVNGGGGGYYFFGFQFGNVNTASDDNAGCIQLGMNAITGVPNGTASQILFEAGSIEGPHYCHFIRGFERAFATFRNVSFQGTVTDGTKMLGFLKWTLASNSRITFDGCELKGNFVNTALTSISGASTPIIDERDWRIEYNGTAINAGGTIYSGFGVWWGLLWQAGLTSGRAEQYNCYMSDGRWWRKGATFPLEWSDDPAAATWKPIGTDVIKIAVTDEVTAFTAGTGKATFRMPYAFRVTAVRAELSTAQAASGGGGIQTYDINENGVSILSTKLTIDNGEKTSTTAATAAVVSDSALADDAEITIDIDQIGDGSARGLKISIIGYRN